MAYIIAILNNIDHRSLSWDNPHEAACSFTPDAAHLTEFEFWEIIFILDDKYQFIEYRDIFDYYSGPSPNMGAID